MGVSRKESQGKGGRRADEHSEIFGPTKQPKQGKKTGIKKRKKRGALGTIVMKEIKVKESISKKVRLGRSEANTDRKRG